CTKCSPAVPLTSANNQRTLGHNGSHILFDPSIRASDQPCGICLRPYPMCAFFLSKTAETSGARQIDWSRSTCLIRLNFKMAAAQKSTNNSPCTNHLIPCPLQCGRAIWTYNISAHCRGRPHNLSSLDSVPQVYEMASGEMEKMQQLWLDRQNYPKKRNLKNKSANPLRLSDAHLARNAITYVFLGFFYKRLSTC
ncbi:hypothetical protein FB451DRAFT_1063298, partial [Mycena latifolia]